MLTYDSAWQFPATLLTVALLPAVCEEFAFRGVIQPLVAKWTNNIHAAVWMAAFLFSAIHLQFHGFLPRMVLGAGLGYLVIYSNSLWPAIAAHFFNNAGAIFMAAIYGPEWVAQEMNAAPEWAASITASPRCPCSWAFIWYGGCGKRARGPSTTRFTDLCAVPGGTLAPRTNLPAW